MKYIRMLLAVASVIVTITTSIVARADEGDRGLILYTPLLRGDTFDCNAVNVSDKSLDVVFTILDDNGIPLSGAGNPSPVISTPPGAVAAQDTIQVSPTNEGYCKVEVFGTRDRRDVRVDLTITLVRSFLAKGTTTPPIPVLVFRTVEGH